MDIPAYNVGSFLFWKYLRTFFVVFSDLLVIFQITAKAFKDYNTQEVPDIFQKPGETCVDSQMLCIENVTGNVFVYVKG